MPPKKGKTPAATTAPVPEPPATVTSARGKEFDTTAAAARPRRDGTTAAVPVSKKAPVAKPSSATATPSKKRGRPAKAAVTEDATEEAVEPPKKRGRPAKSSPATTQAKSSDVLPPKPRGRPSKKTATATTTTAAVPEDNETTPPKKRGRPSKNAPAVPEEDVAPPKKRGVPPFGGETTKIETDADAAAEQLEDELMDTTAVEEEPKDTAGKRKATVSKKGNAAAKTAKAAQDEEEREAAAAADEPLDETKTDNHYWLMKAEQEDRFETLQSGREFNTKFTIDDLRSKSEPEPWDGVRNPVAAKNMRTMKRGDLAFFYASGGKAGRKPGITGIIEVVKEHEPDPSTHDQDSYGYVEKESDRGRWCVVHVEFRKKLSQPVHLAEMQKFAQANGVLGNMQVLKSTRLSVTEVSEKEWNFITENLIQGYEENDGVADAPNGNEHKNIKAPNGDALNGALPHPKASSPVSAGELELPDGNATANPLPSVETNLSTSELPSTKTLQSAAVHPGSTTTSRAVSRAASRGPAVTSTESKVPNTTSRPASRAGSLAPPARPNSRGRSRTPKPRAGSAQPLLSTTEGVPAGMQTIEE